MASSRSGMAATGSRAAPTAASREAAAMRTTALTPSRGSGVADYPIFAGQSWSPSCDPPPAQAHGGCLVAVNSHVVEVGRMLSRVARDLVQGRVNEPHVLGPDLVGHRDNSRPLRRAGAGPADHIGTLDTSSGARA